MESTDTLELVPEHSDLLDTALGLASTTDWLSPMLAFAGDALHGGGYTILVDWAFCQYSGFELKAALEARGIQVWGLMIVGIGEGSTLTLTVPLVDVKRAGDLLTAWGVPWQ